MYVVYVWHSWAWYGDSRAGSKLGSEKAHDAAACYPNFFSPSYHVSSYDCFILFF